MSGDMIDFQLVKKPEVEKADSKFLVIFVKTPKPLRGSFSISFTSNFLKLKN